MFQKRISVVLVLFFGEQGGCHRVEVAGEADHDTLMQDTAAAGFARSDFLPASNQVSAPAHPARGALDEPGYFDDGHTEAIDRANASKVIQGFDQGVAPIPLQYRLPLLWQGGALMMFDANSTPLTWQKMRSNIVEKVREKREQEVGSYDGQPLGEEYGHGYETDLLSAANHAFHDVAKDGLLHWEQARKFNRQWMRYSKKRNKHAPDLKAKLKRDMK